MEQTISPGALKCCLFSDTTSNILKNTTNLIAAFFSAFNGYAVGSSTVPK